MMKRASLSSFTGFTSKERKHHTICIIYTMAENIALSGR